MAKSKCTIDLKTLLEDHWRKEYKDNEQRMLKHKIRKRNLFGNWHPRWLSSEKSCPSQSGGLRCGYVIDGELKDVRFIAINDSMDLLVESSNDFSPIRNWVNELHAKDSSKKARAVKKMRAECGERLGGRPPYGYCKVDNDAVLKKQKDCA